MGHQRRAKALRLSRHKSLDAVDKFVLITRASDVFLKTSVLFVILAAAAARRLVLVKYRVCGRRRRTSAVLARSTSSSVRQ